MTDITREYYEKKAQQYAERTLPKRKIEMARESFLQYVPTGGRIIDVGCGPGWDTLEFLKRGFSVHAIDRSAAMIDMTREAVAKTGFNIGSSGGIERVLNPRRFTSEICTVDPYDDKTLVQFSPVQADGIWACCSLVHIADGPGTTAEDKMFQILLDLSKCLRYAGRPFYLSVKTGNGPVVDEHGRSFYYPEPRILARDLCRTGMTIEQWWTDSTSTPGVVFENIIAKKVLM